MLIPQYTIRWLLGVMTVCAGLFSILALGVRGVIWAAAVSIALGSLVILMLLYALLFALIWGVAMAVPRWGAPRAGRSPFRPQPAHSGNPFLRSDASAEPDGQALMNPPQQN
jgi:hypothetical protein